MGPLEVLEAINEGIANLADLPERLAAVINNDPVYEPEYPGGPLSDGTPTPPPEREAEAQAPEPDAIGEMLERFLTSQQAVVVETLEREDLEAAESLPTLPMPGHGEAMSLLEPMAFPEPEGESIVPSTGSAEEGKSLSPILARLADAAEDLVEALSNLKPAESAVLKYEAPSNPYNQSARNQLPPSPGVQPLWKGGF